MTTLKFVDTHNMVVFLSKPIESDGFEQIVDFLNAHPIRKPKRKDTQVPQSSDPIENIVNEAIHKELGDSLVSAATTASSLEVEQDSGGGPCCQKTIEDTIAQTRFESLSKHCTDSLLARGNTLQSDEDRLKLDELMALCTTLQHRVLDLIGLTGRVESSDNEESLGEDASKQGRIDAIDADEEITLVSVHDVNVFAGEEVFATTVDDITLAQVLKEMKSTKPKKKGAVIQELELVKPMNKKDLIRLDEETALNIQAKFDEEERLARKKFEKEEGANIALIETWDDIQAKIDVDHSYWLKKLVKGKKRAGTELIQEITKKQKVEDDKETTELKQLMKIIPDEEEVAIDAIPLAVKSPSIVGWKIYKEGRKSYYQIIRADGKSQMYMIFSQMLKSFDREDLEDLYKLVKAKYESTRPVEDLDLLLWGDLKTMFEPHVEDKIYMLVEKKYPLAPLTLLMMLEKKLMIDYESEMAYQLLKFIIKLIKSNNCSWDSILLVLMKL
ncbi:hypothetical protein Tco_0409044 [Tanacetum coccineum]